ncbi:MAG: hypothetical protein KatS3mg124_0814 [Porticoccaceae bacterium]|nr:MAG: hypothetical protein KatS3mg124_0814 [Porticoccaceae bacterium]
MEFLVADRQTIAALAGHFRTARPYGYANVGALFDPGWLQAAAREIDLHLASLPAEPNFYGSHRKHRLSDAARLPPTVASLVAGLNAPPFLAILEEISGIAGLRADPELRGGGVHAIGAGGYLKLHTDFNWHPGLGLYRRLNLLIYLNEDWPDEWGGHVELWDETLSRRLYSLAPRLGNALLFETTDTSFHGHPDPLRCPEGIFRKSIALYYYTADRPAEHLRFGPCQLTQYRERPGERFAGDRLRRFRHRCALAWRRLLHRLRSG